EEPVQPDGGEEEGDAESERVGREEEHPAGHRLLEAGEHQDRGEYRPDARSPPRAEGDTGEDGPCLPRGFGGEVDSPIAEEGGDPEPAEHIEAETGDDDPAELLDERERASQHGAERGGGGAEGDEESGEAEDEEPRVDRR